MSSELTHAEALRADRPGADGAPQETVAEPKPAGADRADPQPTPGFGRKAVLADMTPAATGEPVIRVEDVSKCYHIYDKPHHRLLQSFARFHGKSFHRDFWALRGVSFEVRRDEHGVEAKRKGASDRTLMMILRSELTPEARVDLHGLTRDAAMRVVRQFLKDARARSRLTLLLIHGKGAHSEGGIGVLEEACVEALTKGGSAPYVEAFATAPQKFGGRGAIVVRLRKK